MDTLRRVEQLLFSRFPHSPTTGQQEACSAMVRFLYDPDPQAAFILRGYAGTGKTSLLGALIKIAPQLRIRTVLLAPTGRAAKVLSNYSGSKAYTIHKKIYMTVTDASGITRVARVTNKHSYTLFIVDEASMIGMEDALESGPYAHRSLLEDLVDYVVEGNHCRLLFVGDSAQLPPVGTPLSPALDADYLESLSSLHISQYELTEVVRQRDQSGILFNATLLRNQIARLMESEPPELPLFDVQNCSDIVSLGGADLEETLNEEYGAHSVEEVVLITRSNKRANLFNQAVRNRVLFHDEEVNAGDFLMVVKNNYYWLDETSDMGFIANGDIVEVMGVRKHQELYGFHFVEATLRFVDYPDAPTIDCTILLETLHSEAPSLTREESQHLFDAVMEDYADIPVKAERVRKLKQNPYFNALQVKFAYALTCHKTQGGQWKTVFVDQGYLTDDMLDREYLRWLYTALTRATSKVYLLNFQERFFSDETLGQ